MPIVFESIQDPYGIASAGSILGQALMQRNLEALQNQRQLESEERAEQRDIRKSQRELDVKKAQGPILAEALKVAQDITKSVPERLSALQEYVSKTGDNTVMPLFKEIAKEQRDLPLLASLGLSPQSQNVNPTQGQLATTQPPSPVQENALKNLTNQQLVTLSSAQNPQLSNLAKAEIENRKLEQQKFEADRKYHSEISTPYELALDKERESLRAKRFAVPQMIEAIKSGNFGFFSLDNLANMFGIDALRTASGAKLVGAAKEFLLSNISRAGARPNQWIEQQISAALPQVSQKPEAASTLAELLRAETDLASERIRVADEIIKQQRTEFRYVNRDIGALVDEKMRDYEQFIQDRTAYRTREIAEEAMTDEDLGYIKKVPEGTPLTPRMGDILLDKAKGNINTAFDLAKKMGFTFFSFDDIDRYK